MRGGSWQQGSLRGRSRYFRQTTAADKDSQIFEWDYFEVLAQSGGDLVILDEMEIAASGEVDLCFWLPIFLSKMHSFSLFDCDDVDGLVWVAAEEV